MYLIDAHASAEHPASQDGPGRPASTDLGQRPGSAGGSRSIEGATEQLDSASGLRPADSGRGVSGGGAEARNNAEMLRMLALYLDLGLHMHMEVGTAARQGRCTITQRGPPWVWQCCSWLQLRPWLVSTGLEFAMS